MLKKNRKFLTAVQISKVTGASVRSVRRSLYSLSHMDCIVVSFEDCRTKISGGELRRRYKYKEVKEMKELTLSEVFDRMRKSEFKDFCLTKDELREFLMLITGYPGRIDLKNRTFCGIPFEVTDLEVK